MGADITANVEDGVDITATVTPSTTIVAEVVAGGQGPSGVLTAATFTTNGSVKQTVYNIRDYGAVGDGVTNDVVAIQACIDAAVTGNGRTYAPPGTYLIGGTGIRKDTDNVYIYGDGHDKTIFKNGTSSGSTMINIGNAGGPTVRSNAHIEGLTIDMNSTRCWGIVTTWYKDVMIRDVKVINPATTAFSMIFVGLFSNMSATWDAKNITIEDCIFDYGGVSSSWEGVTLGFARDIKVRNCEFLNKPGIAALLNYNSEVVSITDNQFFQCQLQVGGRGPITVKNNKFESSYVHNWAANNVIYEGNSFLGTSADPGAGRNVSIGFEGNYFPSAGGGSTFLLK